MEHDPMSDQNPSTHRVAMAKRVALKWIEATNSMIDRCRKLPEVCRAQVEWLLVELIDVVGTIHCALPEYTVRHLEEMADLMHDEEKATPKVKLCMRTGSGYI